MNANKLLLAGLAGLMLAGCRGTPPAPVGPSSGSFDSGSTLSSNNDGGSGVFTDGLNDGSGAGSVRSFANATQDEIELLNNSLIVYFEFDSSDIRADFDDMLAAHGRYLASNANESVRLEGHADERGSREYNIGLGERRAQSVRQILLLQGASASQLSTVSYGEEIPAVFGSDEEAYGLNRRVEIVYR